MFAINWLWCGVSTGTDIDDRQSRYRSSSPPTRHSPNAPIPKAGSGPPARRTGRTGIRRPRFERHLAEARLPRGNTLENFHYHVAPMVSKAHVNPLIAGNGWPANDANLIVVGQPRTCKSHLRAAIRLAQIKNGFQVLYLHTTDLVQKLQVARRELMLKAEIRKLNKHHLLILADIAYVRKDQAETNVLFKLISSLYDNLSLLVTANQPFGEWARSSPNRP